MSAQQSKGNGLPTGASKSPVPDNRVAAFGTNKDPISDLLRSVPVSQSYSGPASTFINIFQHPGDYNIKVRFRPEGPMIFPPFSDNGSQGEPKISTRRTQ